MRSGQRFCNVDYLRSQNIGLVMEECYLEKIDYYLYSIIDNNKIGFINKEAEIIITPMFDKIQGSFVDETSLVRVAINDKWGVIKSNGSLVIPLIYKSISIFGSMIYVQDSDSKRGVYNDKSIEIVPIGKYKVINPFFMNDNITRVRTYDRKWGIINDVGDIVLETKYNLISSFTQDQQSTCAKIDNQIYDIDLEALRKYPYTKKYCMEGKLLYKRSQFEIERELKHQNIKSEL